MELMDLSHTLYFNPSFWEGKSIALETHGLNCAYFIYARLVTHSLLPGDAAGITVQKYGPSTIAKRLISFMSEDEYLKGSLAIYHPALVQVLCGIEVVRERFVAQRGHIAVLQRGWKTLRTLPTTRQLDLRDFGPRRWLQVLFR